MNHPQRQRIALEDEECTSVIIGAAIEVHRHLGPGLLESIYQRCLAHELMLRGALVQAELPVSVVYKDLVLPDYRMDLLVDERVIVEVKAVERIHSVHTAQLMTYLRLTGKKVGLLLNFNVEVLKDGIVRRVI